MFSIYNLFAFLLICTLINVQIYAYRNPGRNLAGGSGHKLGPNGQFQANPDGGLQAVRSPVPSLEQHVERDQGTRPHSPTQPTLRILVHRPVRNQSGLFVFSLLMQFPGWCQSGTVVRNTFLANIFFQLHGRDRNQSGTVWNSPQPVRKTKVCFTSLYEVLSERCSVRNQSGTSPAHRL